MRIYDMFISKCQHGAACTHIVSLCVCVCTMRLGFMVNVAAGVVTQLRAHAASSTPTRQRWHRDYDACVIRAV